MSKQAYLTIKKLKEEIIKLKVCLKKGSGSGKNGNIIRKDLIYCLKNEH